MKNARITSSSDRYRPVPLHVFSQSLNTGHKQSKQNPCRFRRLVFLIPARCGVRQRRRMPDHGSMRNCLEMNKRVDLDECSCSRNTMDGRLSVIDQTRCRSPLKPRAAGRG